MKKITLLLASATLLFSSCFLGSNEKKEEAGGTSIIDGHPSWIMQGNIYEVNVRQYTAEGTFKAFEKHLARLKDMGVQTLWFMPIQPIGVVDRKGALGSYYAISNYKAINPEFGSMDDWKALVKQCHEMGFKVIIDWVANHTAADHYWLNSNPDFYVRDSAGKALSPFDWTDVRKLNYRTPALYDSMISSLQYWITESDIDGFRCDVAEDVPRKFWSTAFASLKKTKPSLFFLAEGNMPWLHDAGFDATYTWNVFGNFAKIVKGERTALTLDTIVNALENTFPGTALRLYFTSNHDENSWNKADYGTTPGATHAPFAVFTQTVAHTIPLIYSGQEEPFLDSLSFFYKDTITFSKFERQDFYKALLALRKRNPALAANASMRKVSIGNDKALYAYVREASGKKVLVILNLSNQTQTATINDTSLYGTASNIFSNKQETIDNKPVNLGPWQYLVYEY